MIPLVLVAEDNPDHALLTVEALETAHDDRIDVHVVADGQEALDYLADPSAGLPNLILLDIRMPRLDGFATLAAIKQHPTLRVIPVVMLTSSDDERDIANSYGLGSNSYVTKPVGIGELLDRIGRIPSYWFGVNTLPSGGCEA